MPGIAAQRWSAFNFWLQDSWGQNFGSIPTTPSRQGSWAVWGQWSQLLPRLLQALLHVLHLPQRPSGKKGEKLIASLHPHPHKLNFKGLFKTFNQNLEKKKVVKNHWVSFKFIGTADGKGLVNFLFILPTLTNKLLSLFSSLWHYSSWCAWEVEPLLICSLQSVPKCGWQSAMAQHPNPRWQLLWRDTTTVSLCSSPASSGSHADISSALFTALIPRGRK